MMDRVKLDFTPVCQRWHEPKGSHTYNMETRDGICSGINGRYETWPKLGVLGHGEENMRMISESRKIGFFVDVASDFVR